MWTMRLRGLYVRAGSRRSRGRILGRSAASEIKCRPSQNIFTVYLVYPLLSVICDSFLRHFLDLLEVVLQIRLGASTGRT
jgi:hypothetical protein